MVFPDAASRGLAVLLWVADGLLWALLAISCTSDLIFLRGALWIFILLTALLLPIPAAHFWRASNHNPYPQR